MKQKPTLAIALFLFGMGTALAQSTFAVGDGVHVVSTGAVTVDYHGDALVNNGTVAITEGTLSFSNPVAFSGSGTTSTNNLTVNHGGTTFLDNRIAVKGTLTVANGTLSANDNLTLVSDASGTAVIAPVASGAVINGKVTVQRYIPMGKRAFRFLTPGVTTDNFISNNWQQDTHITGSTSGANGFDATTTGSASLFTYNNQQPSGSGWAAVSNTNATNLNAMQGYRILIRGDRNVDINSASEPMMNTAITLNATGTVLTGDVVFNSNSSTPINSTSNTTTNGYSLIGNPYVNTVNWNTLTRSGLTDTYYSWDANMGTATQRGRYVAISATTGTNNIASPVNQYIQPGQAFLVKNSVLGTAGSLTFHESDKAGIAANNSIFRTSTNALTRLDLQVYESTELALGNYPIDAAVTVFGSAFTNEVEDGDVSKLSTGVENIAFVNNNRNFAIDARPEVAITDELLVNLQQFQPNKNYTFRTHFADFDSTVTPFLSDTYLNQLTPLSLEMPSDVAFTTTADAASYAANRFRIVFQATALGTNTFQNENVVLYPNPVTDNRFALNLPSTVAGDVNITLFNTIGQKVYAVKKTAQASLVITPDLTLAKGVYLVQLQNKGTTVTKKITIQ